MTPRTFWIIFIKILGIWLVLASLTVLPNAATVFSVFSYGGEGEFLGMALAITLVVLTLLFYFFILYMCLFKTKKIVDLFKLDRGFPEEKIDIDVNRKTVIAVAAIVIGGLIFIDALPTLIQQIFAVVQQKEVFRESPTASWLFYHLAETVIGYLLVMNGYRIASFIDRKSSQVEEPEQ